MRQARLLIVILIAAPLASLTGCGDRADSLARLRADVRRNPDSVEARVRLGEAYLESEAWHDAYIQFSDALRLDGASFDATLGLARAQEALNDIDDAAGLVERALAINPDSPEALALQGQLLLRTDRPEEAARVLEKAVAIQPDNETAHLHLPIAYLRTDARARAEEAARAAIEAMPESVETHMNLALVLIARDRPGEAETLLRAAMELDPGDPAPPFRLAELLVSEGRQLEEAITLADRAGELEPGRGDSDALAALALRKLGRDEEAVRRLHVAAMAHPRNVPLWLMLARTYRDMGEEEAAARAAGMAYRFAPRRRVRAGSADDDSGDAAPQSTPPPPDSTPVHSAGPGAEG